MSKKSNRKGHKMLAYVLAWVLFLTAVPVAVSQADEGTAAFASQAAAYKKEWEAKGNDGKTTLFIGDSFMSPKFWFGFYDTYAGKDVLRAGISSSTTYDWEVFTPDYLAYTNPKNIVVHIGTNNIYDDKNDVNETYNALLTMFNGIHTTLPDTKIYYFGIPTRKDKTYQSVLEEVNAKMTSWCSERNWITYIDTSAVTASDLRDGVHLKPERYSILVDALAKTDIEIEDAKKNMDVYLIAGQSNAAGWTTYDKATLSAMDSRYVNGFDNIYYSGAVAELGKLDTTLREFPVQEVKAGLGIQEDKIGPELGMAESLSSRYNSETGEYAGFIKYAVGAASLLKDPDKDANETWTSPTYMVELGTSVTDGTGMGILYNNFLDEVEVRLAEYEAKGFNPIIKGMYWMQGEADRRREAEYIDAFEAFASDVRKDLSTVSGQDLSKMPIMVGEISETFYAYKTATLNANREFLAMQGMLPSLVSDCYLIDNSGFAITAEDPNNPEPSDQNSEEYAAYKGTIVGSDNSHWNYNDCISIGNQVGDQILAFDTVETGDINADTRVDKTDVNKLKNMLARNIAGSSRMIAPDVYVSYDGGQVVNDADGTIAVETSKFDNNSKPTAFVKTDIVSYTASRNDDAKGAIITNHYSGPYTVVNDYGFGKEDFTVSTWFKVPEEATISGGSGTYIMGNDQPDGTKGISVTLKETQLRFRILSTTKFWDFTYDRNVWYNLVVNRECNVLRIFLDGELLYTESIPEAYDFETRDFSVGAYVGLSGASAEMYFDDVQVYGTALSASEIKAIAESDILIPERNDVNLDKTLNVKDLVDLKIAVANFKGAEPVDVDAADVAVNFDGGTVKNSGSNSSMTAGAYVLGGFETVNVNGVDKQKATRFDATTNVTYTNGRDGAANGAILTNYQKGAYTVLDKLNLEKEDFAVSTWFNIPTADDMGTGNGCYLLGTTKADDTTSGFRVNIRQDNTDGGKIKLFLKAGANGDEKYVLDNFTYGKWHHVAVSRIGNAMFFYYDGELASIQIIGEDFDFGDAKVAFGAYPGVTWKYDDRNVAYDDVRFYKGEVTVAHVRDIYGVENVPGGDEGGDDSGDTGDDTTEPTTAKVRVTFDGGKVANSGTDTNATVGTYVMDATTNGTKFVETNTVSYATGRDGSANGAIITNHQTGPYIVIKNGNIGKGDFTVSTWFNTEKASAIGNNAGFYLFGTNKPDTGKGFSICIKKVSEEYRLRIRGAYKSTDESIVIPNIESNTWYNVTIARVGSVINLYFDGSLVGTYTVDAYDFENRELAFGGYYGLADTYNNEETYFDDIYVYGEGLSASQIREKIMGIEPAKVRVTFNGGETENSGTDTKVTAKTYLLNDSTLNATEFIETDTVTYEAGRDGSANGAIVTNHSTGPYTVLKNCNLGTGDFTISTWFNTERTTVIGIGPGGYLFGTSHPDASVDSGFSVALKRKTKGTEDYQIRFRGAGASTQFSGDGAGEATLPAVQPKTWYNIVVTKVGTTLNIYFDGEMVLTCSVNTDFGSKDLAFGAQPGLSYNNVNTYYDDIEIYGVGFSAEQVQKMYTMNK